MCGASKMFVRGLIDLFIVIRFMVIRTWLMPFGKKLRKSNLRLAVINISCEIF